MVIEATPETVNWENTTDVVVFPAAVPVASNYGCGSDTCQVCYPVLYRCEHGIDYPQPVLNNPPGRELPCDHHDEIEEID